MGKRYLDNSLLRALRHRPFVLLWIGQIISRLGDSLYRIALAWWVLEQTGSAAAMGTVLIFAFTPQLLFLLVGGVAVDRFPRLRVMLASDLLSGSMVALVAALAFTGRLEIWHIYVMSGIFGFVSAFFEPAYAAAIPDLMPAELLPSANSLTSLSIQLVGVVGPAVGALLVAIGGTSTAFAINALSFFISAACLLGLPALPAHAAAGGSSGVLGDVREGLATVWHSPWLWITIAVFSLVNVTQSGPQAVALPFLVRETYGAGVNALGLIYGCSSAGAVLTAVWLGRSVKLRNRGPWAYGAALAGGLMTMMLGLPIGLWGVVLASFAGGASITLFGLIWTNTLQELVPRERLGRVISIDMLGSFVLLPIGYGIAGWATDRLGAPLVFVIGGLSTVVMLALALLHPAIRGLD